MLFNSYIFILLFLPLCVAGYYIINRFGQYRLASFFLLCMSLWFYGYFNVKYLPLIIASILVNFSIYKGFGVVDSKNCTASDAEEGEAEASSRPPVLRGLLLLIGIIFNLGILFYYKYYDFFVTNINAAFGTSWHLKKLLLPLGISFFSFQQLGFVIDSYRREVPDYDFLNYALFVSFFPQLIAGPIVKHDELVPQFQDPARRRVSWDNMAKGIYIFVMGLSKKVLLADIFGNAVNYCYSNASELTPAMALMALFAYPIQLYFDFSGYCDMAIGIGRMLNVELPVNFNSPYKARHMGEMWDRWHMTLTRFFTKYVYIPLGGNRRGALRTYLNVMIVFLLSGLWHGAGWNFVLWGAINGLMVVMCKMCGKWIDKTPRIIGTPVTFTLWSLVYVFFRAETFEQAGLVFAQLKTVWDGIKVSLANLVSGISASFGAVSASEISAVSQGQSVLSFTQVLGIPEAAAMAADKGLAGLESLSFIFSKVLGKDIISVFVPDMLSVSGIAKTTDPRFFLGYLALAIILLFFCKNAKEHMDSLRPNILLAIALPVLLLLCLLSFSGVSTFLYFNF